MNKIFSEILIVDDEESLLDILEESLAGENRRIYKALNGAQALKIVRNNDIDVAVIDFKMPEMNGIQLVEKMNAVDMNIAKIMVTAFADKDIIIQALKLGVFDFIEKPFSMEVLVNRVSNGIDKVKYDKMLNYALKEFIILYCDIKDPDSIDQMEYTQKKHLLDTALKLLIIKDTQREFKNQRES